MTFNETNVTATCCKLDGTPVSVVCGRGYSCAALCFSEEASLCPSDNCANCEDLEERPQQQRGRSSVTRPSSKLSHCTRNGCKVRGRFKACCFHPRCAKRRQRQCSWLNYLVGKFELPVWKRLTSTKKFRPQVHTTWWHSKWTLVLWGAGDTNSRDCRLEWWPGNLSRCSGTEKVPLYNFFPSAYQCRLDCNAGYVSDLSPVITCVEGSYES